MENNSKEIKHPTNFPFIFVVSYVLVFHIKTFHEFKQFCQYYVRTENKVCASIMILTVQLALRNSDNIKAVL
jgi:hypothetical protein